MTDPIEMISLNRFQLDVEAQQQSHYYYEVGEELAGAKSLRDRATNKLKTRKAEIEIDLRVNPPKEPKITEAVVAAFLAKDPELIELETNLVDLSKGVAHLEGLLRSLDHKKSMLDNLVRLYLSGYYADPKRDGATASQTQGLRGYLNRNQATQEQE